ncbi:hypothetical protein APSETT444_004020 [Aspergillus pseudonomiae]
MSTTNDPTNQPKANARTVTWQEVSEWQFDNKYILSGYRPANADYLVIFTSLAFLHNETCNVHTHLIGALLLPLVATTFLWYLGEPQFLNVSSMDYAMVLTTGTATGVLTSNSLLKTPRWRKVKVGTFGIFGASSFIPLLHGVQRYGLEYMLQYSGIKWYLLELTFYGTGVGLYAFRIPERLAPGRFDIWGSSHQLFHIAISCVMYTHLIALLQGFTTSHTLEVCRLQGVY